MTVSQSSLRAPKEAPFHRLLTGFLLFVAAAAIGLFIVKWQPYWNKSFVAAAHHSIGGSIVNGGAAAAPPVGIAAALSYGEAYFAAVWEAVVLALVLASAVQVFVPRRWLLQIFGKASLKSTALASVLSLAGMMCTCCTAPLIVGLRRQNASVGSALAFFLGNPVLNPATLIFIFFVLGWPFALVRIIAGIALVLALATLANRIAPDANVPAPDLPALAPIEDPNRSAWTLALAWVKELGRECVTILPGYIAIVLLVGGLRAWLFPAMIHANGLTATGFFALVGTAFVIPTAGEVPIIQTLMHQGLGFGPAIALLITLPAISLPSIFIVRNALPKRVLALAAGGVALTGFVAGIIAMFVMHA